ncbi:MAG: hypothetical protein ABSF64_12890 [Bryobacteraceae bacterium]|jgi:hypothetical protein
MGIALRYAVLKPVRIALCLAVWLAPGWGATLELLSLNDLISKSTTIVQAQVTGSSASYSGTAIYTHYKVTVLAQWKGAPQGTIDVMVPGGTANGVRQTFAGVPQLMAGQQYVLFLWAARQGATYTLGLTQGVFNLLGAPGDLTAVQMPTTETVLAPGTGKVVNSQPISMPLPQLISSIKAGGN